MRPGRQGRMRPCPRRCMHRLAERRMRRSAGSRMRDPEIPFQALRTLDSRKVQPGGPGKRLIHAFSESSFEGFESHIPFSPVQRQSTRWLVVQKHRGRYRDDGSRVVGCSSAHHPDGHLHGLVPASTRWLRCCRWWTSARAMGVGIDECRS